MMYRANFSTFYNATYYCHSFSGENIDKRQNGTYSKGSETLAAAFLRREKKDSSTLSVSLSCLESLSLSATGTYDRRSGPSYI
jgi:hypothetical protein